MKKLSILFVAATCALFLFSCKKSSSSSSTGTISASLNGTATSFNTDAIGVAASSSGVYTVQVEGFNGTPSVSVDVPTMTIQLESTSPIVAGSTFTDTSFANTASVSYIQQPGNVIYDEEGNLGGSTPDVNVKITSASSTNIQGTFTATATGGTTPATYTITNGTFNVKL